MQYDRTLLVADNRRCEPKKFGGMYNIWGLVEGRGWKRANVGNRTGSESEIPEVVSLRLSWERGRGGWCGALLLSWLEVKNIILCMIYVCLLCQKRTLSVFLFLRIRLDIKPIWSWP